MRDAPTREEVAMTPRPIAPHPNTATDESSVDRDVDKYEKIFVIGLRLTDSCLFGDCAPGSSDATTKETDFLEGCFLVDCDDRDVCYDRVLREGRGAHLCAY